MQMTLYNSDTLSVNSEPETLYFYYSKKLFVRQYYSGKK